MRNKSKRNVTIHRAALTLISTFLVFKLNLIWSCRCSTMGVNIFIQFSFSGVYLLAGTGTFLISPFPTCGQRGGEQRTRADSPGPAAPLGPTLTPMAAAGSGGKAGLLPGRGPAASVASAASIGSAPSALRFLRPRLEATLVKPLSSAASVSMATTAVPKLASPPHPPRGSRPEESAATSGPPSFPLPAAAAALPALGMSAAGLERPQVVAHVQQSLNYTVFDCKWVPRSARLLCLGSAPRGTGVLQLYELRGGRLLLLSEVSGESR